MQRKIRKHRWAETAGFLLLVILIALAPSSRASIAFTPPDDSVDAANELKSIDRELADRNYPAAAKRLDLLLAARGHPLAALAQRTLTSVDAWLDQIPADARLALAVECKKQFGTTARHALESLQGSRATRPDEFYALARRYPLTDAAGAAFVAAADLALRTGDLPAAQACYQLAQREQYPLGEDRQRRLQFLNETLAAAPADGAKPPAAGPLPFDALWFGNPSTMRQAKFFPAAYDDRILLASWKSVTMLREDGQVIWSVPNAKAPTAFNPDRTASNGTPGALFAPATLTDVDGHAAILVVRQPVAPGESQFALFALRASDGKLLWSTDASPNRAADLTYAGLPAVCGRYVYCVAVARTGVSTANFVLAALDVATGQQLWQTALGAVTEEGEHGGADRNFGRKFGRNPPLSLEGFARISEPAVAGDLVVVAPNCGSLIAVDRFAGNIRWIGAYRAAANPAQGGGVDRNGRWIPPIEADRALLTRYRSTPLACGNVIAVMPQDAPALFAFDRATGRQRWETETDIANTCALAGASGNIAVACGAAIVGIDAGGTGKLKWKYTPPRGIHITGPAVVQGRTVLAPTTLGIVQLNTADGAEKPTYTVPSFRHLLTTEAGRSAVTESGAAATFGFSPSAR